METLDGYESNSSTSTTYSNYAEERPDKKYKCSYDNCGKAFFRPSKLENHKRIHTGEKPFICEMDNCDKSYHRKDLLKKHQGQVHLKNVKYVECPQCKQKMRQNSLNKHYLRKHNSFRQWRFQCEVCNKGFRNQNELNNHMNGHFPIFRCPTCDKEFKSGSLFRRHVKSHKEYECLCKEKFYDNNIFRTHKKNCEFTRPTCNICSHKFAKNSNLKEHLNIVHGLVKDIFLCTFEGCNRQYERKSSWRYHVSKDHKNKKDEEETKIVCEICSLGLKNEATLWKHIKNVHITKNKKEDKPRKPRRDKNIPKIPMLTILTGITHPVEKNNGGQEDIETQPMHFVCDKEGQEEPCSEINMEPAVDENLSDPLDISKTS